MDGDFYVAASLATTLTKVALRYVALVQDKKKQNVSYSSFISIKVLLIICPTFASSDPCCLGAPPCSLLLQRPC